MIDLEKVVFFDFECFSEVDVGDVGAYNYAQHPTTEITTLAYKFRGQNDVRIWSPEIPKIYDPFPSDLRFAINDGYTFVAHNTFFDFNIWNELGHRFLDFPYLHIDQIADTMALCGAHGLPLSLENASKALKLPIQKDIEGEELMLLMCKPRKPTKKDPRKRIWDLESKEKLIKYNKIDVQVLEQIWNSLNYLSPFEHEIWKLTFKINLRGVPCDLKTAKSALILAEKLKVKYTAELRELTDEKIQTGGQVKKIKEYLSEEFFIDVDSLNKYSLEKLIKSKDIPPKAKRLLELRQILGRSSFAKFQQLLDKASPDGINEDYGLLRETLIYHLASTGRWGSKGFQLHNLPKYFFYMKEDDNPDERLELVSKIIQSENLDVWEIFYGNDSKPLSGFIRSCLLDPYSDNIYCGDYSGVEARGVFWIAGEQEALDAYATGKDLYIGLASDIFKKPESEVTKKERNDFGKPGILGSGYGMGGVKMSNKLIEETDLDIEQFGKDLILSRINSQSLSLFDYCVLLRQEHFENRKRELEYNNFLIEPEYHIEKNPEGFDYAIAFGTSIIMAYRQKYKKVRQYWKDINNTVIKALLTNELQELGVLKIFPEKEALYIQLPSGRKLCYWGAKVEKTVSKFGKETYEAVYYGVDQKTKQFKKQHTFGGFWTENVVQAICRDLLAHAMLNLEKAGYKNLFTVHDEDVAKKVYDGSIEEFKSIMEQKPSWAKGFPIDVEVWKGRRYRK